MKELGQAVGQGHVGDLFQLNPCRFRRIVAGHRVLVAEDGDLEVQHDEMGITLQELHPADQSVAHRFESGLLRHLPDHGLGEGLPPFEPTSRN